MKSLLASVLLILSSLASAGTLPFPSTVTLSPAIHTARCYAATAHVTPDAVVTGFSADGAYVLGQADSTAVCGSSGRGGDLHYYSVCVQLQWDLTGTLVSTIATPTIINGVVKSVPCAPVALVYPVPTPPSSTVVGNEFVNAGGYIAETVLVEACGSIACYATYYEPTLETP
jgi:hypothetical protein